ncbi:DUF3090 domain-containing protein [Gordonia sp. (in: high G+C Gram-positive bacteria)]|uniref:DUF3090 domain-containing protein n=1 Tax=Gordonia sp. (in: high G+C Gram-positive bacteria) TaxID=84139 RepID=UPI00261CD824|nr:DUF3090 domain-containing protein [Gordonia sp. (in: high G+C Gram-positive bacteria)]HMS75379.1 DUF3090 domain-containing protein [Gordonia sp. (in: high G+C Gram-positive bacteria)]
MARAIHVFRSPDRFVAGTVGQPGDRTFFLQAVHQARVVSVMLEKQQVQILADRIGMLLEEIHRRFGTPIPPETESVDDLNPLVMPVDAEFQVGTMGLGWDAEAQAVVIELLAVTDAEIDESIVLDDTEEGPDAVRVFLTTVAARDFAAHSSLVISAGRPPCPICGGPLDRDGHLCVRTNGYKRSAQLSKSLDFIDPEVFKSLAVQDESLFTTDDDSEDEDAQGEADSGPDDEGPASGGRH